MYYSPKHCYLPTFSIVAAIIVLAAFFVFLKRPEYLIYLMLFVPSFHFFVTQTLLNSPNIGNGVLSLGGIYQDIWPTILIGVWDFLCFSFGFIQN